MELKYGLLAPVVARILLTFRTTNIRILTGIPRMIAKRLTVVRTTNSGEERFTLGEVLY